MYESTTRPTRPIIHLGKRGPAVDSCTIGTQMGRLIPDIDAVRPDGVGEGAGGGSQMCPGAWLSYNGRD